MLSIDAIDMNETEKPNDHTKDSDQVLPRGITSVINLLAQFLPKTPSGTTGAIQVAGSEPVSVNSSTHIDLMDHGSH